MQEFLCRLDLSTLKVFKRLIGTFRINNAIWNYINPLTHTDDLGGDYPKARKLSGTYARALQDFTKKLEEEVDDAISSLEMEKAGVLKVDKGWRNH